MKLNVDLVFDNLPHNLDARLSGPREMGLTLNRPQLYEGGEKPLQSGCLYLLHVNRLPRRAHVQRGAVIVCIGESPALTRFRERCSVITVREDADFYTTFNILQDIFNGFDAWEDDLAAIIDSGGSISRLLARSETVLQNPLYAIDSDFRILGASPMAATLEPDSGFQSADGNSLRLGAFDQFLELHDLSMEEREPLVLNLLDQTTLNYNLHEGDEYRGCLTIHYTHRNYRPSDKPLIRFLGGQLLRAMQQLSSNEADSRRSLRQAVQSLVEERPIDTIEREIVESAGAGRHFACLRLKLSSRLEQLPLGYVRNMVDAAFPRSIVFEYHRNSVVAIIDLGELAGEYQDAIVQGIKPFTSSMGMRAGLSDPFDDLMHSRLMFLQANTALDMGRAFEPECPLCRFQDFALREMVMNAIGDIPIDLRLPEGLRRLVEHDRTAPTSYVETLRMYLDCNLSVSKTAARLFVHRSTLMERIQRINRELDMDLEDPDTQLLLRLLLKGMQMHDEMRGGAQ